MARKTVDPQTVKAAKQKKLLLVLAPVLLALIAWQGPKSYKALTGSDAAAVAPPPAVTTTPTSTGPTTTGPTTLTELRDTDLPLEALDGQLISFSRFSGRDPFDQSNAPEGTSTGTGTGSGGTTSGQTANTAELEVNGTKEKVALDRSFPASDPVFKLVSIQGQTANVGLVSGKFSGGSSTIAINVGETLVLVSDPDKTRYVIKLMSVAHVKQ
jgi:hypothetical protein